MLTICTVTMMYSPVAMANIPFEKFHQLSSKQVTALMKNNLKRQQIFAALCMDGKKLKNVTLKDQSTGDELNCGKEALRLNSEITFFRQFYPHKLQVLGNCQSSGAGDRGLAAASALNGDVAQVIQGDLVSCSTTKIKESNGKCAKTVACNVVRSAMFGPLRTMVNRFSDANSSTGKCLNSTGRSDCISEVITGILSGLWGNVTALWQVTKMSASWVGGKIRGLFSSSSDVEDKVANGMHAAEQTSEGFVAKFKKAEIETLKEMGKKIWHSIEDYIAKKFMCKQWEGVPHLSKCKVPLQTCLDRPPPAKGQTCKKRTDPWGCATCEQKLNAACGVAGLLASEIILLYLTGGIVGGIKAVASSGKLAQIGAKVAAALPKIPKSVIRAGGAITATVSAAGARLGALASTIASTPTALAISKFAQQMATKSGELGQVIVNTNLGQITLAGGRLAGQATSVVTSPIRAYFTLGERAFIAGNTAGQRMFSRWGTKATTVAPAATNTARVTSAVGKSTKTPSRLLTYLKTQTGNLTTRLKNFLSNMKEGVKKRFMKKLSTLPKKEAATIVRRLPKCK